MKRILSLIVALLSLTSVYPDTLPVEEIVNIYRAYGIGTKVLAASFKNAEQVHKVSLTGADAATINPDLFDTLIYHPLTFYAIDDFAKDWEAVYGDKKAGELLEKKA